MLERVERKKHRSKRHQRGLFVGTILTIATVVLVYMLPTDSFQDSDSARYVASFIAGLFGFTAVETLRRTLD